MMKYYTLKNGERVVMASARLVPPRGYERSMGIVVNQCPYCLHTHRHTLDSTATPHYGVREADCFKGQYLLVDEDVFEVTAGE